MSQQTLDTRWEGDDLLVLVDEHEIDRIAARDIHRVILVGRGGDAPTDLRFALIETTGHHIVLPATSGIAGRVHFERQAFWQRRACVYWIDETHARLPRRLLRGIWLLRRSQPAFARLPHSELAAVVDAWPVEGPQTWEQRKWARIVRNRMLPPAVGTQPR